MRRPLHHGFTLVEVMVVLLTLGVLVALLAPLRNRDRTWHQDVRCLNRVKNVALAHQIFAMDHESRFPMEIPVREGGSREWLTNAAELWRHFDVLSNELSTPKVLVCPTDQSRTSAEAFRGLPGGSQGSLFSGNHQLSYFLNTDARMASGNTILGGDARLTVSGGPVVQGNLAVDVFTALSFAPGLHHETGNLFFADGSARRVRSGDLPSEVRKASAATGRPTNLWILP